MAFSYCYKLQTVSQINRPFNSCEALTEFTVDHKSKYFTTNKGIFFTKDHATLVAYPNGKRDKNYAIPPATKLIKEWAFNVSKYIENIKFPEGDIAIEPYTFSRCPNLLSFTVPDNVVNRGLLSPMYFA